MTLDTYDRNLIHREARLKRKERLARTNIPKRYWDITWDQYEPRDANVDVADFMETYAKGFSEKPVMHSGKGILLQGEPGVGKTMAACMLGVTLSDSGHLVRFMPLADYAKTLTRQFTLQKAWERYEDQDSFEEWKTNDENLRILREVAHLVIVDDVGKEHHTSTRFAQDEFDVFLRHRLDIARPVVMTSNLLPGTWTATYSESMASFIHEATTIVSFADRDDMRRKAW